MKLVKFYLQYMHLVDIINRDCLWTYKVMKSTEVMGLVINQNMSYDVEGDSMGSRDEQKINEKKMKILKQGIIILILCMIIIILLMVIFRAWREDKSEFLEDANEAIGNAIIGEEGKTATFSEASIRKVFEISELSTADYTYNAVARAYAEDGISVKYYVAYEGKVKAGIDFSKIEIDVNDEDRVVTITIPDIEFQEKTVDPGTLEFIFKDKKSETEQVHQEAFLLCQKDLDEKTNNEKELLSLARTNAKSVVEALVTPWIKQAEEEYTVNIQVEEKYTVNIQAEEDSAVNTQVEGSYK